jgi:uncharacterized protein
MTEMTTIHEQVKLDLKHARKTKNKFTLGVLTTLLGLLDLSAKVIDNIKIVSDEDSIKVIKSYIKGLEEISSVARTTEEFETNQAELVILQSYLPKQLSVEDLQSEIENLAKTHTEFSIRSVMSHLKDNFAGLYDGKTATEIFKKVNDTK